VEKKVENYSRMEFFYEMKHVVKYKLFLQEYPFIEK